MLWQYPYQAWERSQRRRFAWQFFMGFRFGIFN
jgi:hypothetical protein